MSNRNTFSGVRASRVLSVLSAAGCAAALAACSGQSATYRPAPRYTAPPSTATAPPATYYTPPSTTAPRPATPPPAPPAGKQMACAGGKCG